jgi:nucleoside triphosphate pyrophosphatase
LLADAGVEFLVEPAHIDERALKAKLAADAADAGRCALALAEAKAVTICERHGDALIIGADQILVCDDRWFDKPGHPGEARRQLMALRGRSHVLETAVCAVRNGERLW